MRKILLISLLIFLVLSFMSCYGFAVIRKDGPYEGRVIDADTDKPIEGVVVLGVWYKEHPGPGGAVSEYYDAMETVTDKNGEFKINGLGLLVMSNVLPVNILVFKAGYEYESGFWTALKKHPRKIRWEGDKAIIPLTKLTVEERRKQGTPSFPSQAYEKKRMPLLIKEINKEEKVFGRQPYPEE
jgi:hypothetical protein